MPTADPPDQAADRVVGGVGRAARADQAADVAVRADVVGKGLQHKRAVSKRDFA